MQTRVRASDGSGTGFSNHPFRPMKSSISPFSILFPASTPTLAELELRRTRPVAPSVPPVRTCRPICSARVGFNEPRALPAVKVLEF